MRRWWLKSEFRFILNRTGYSSSGNKGASVPIRRTVAFAPGVCKLLALARPISPCYMMYAHTGVLTYMGM